jgi:hypothetical protein
MPVLNTSFELSPGSIWEATSWTYVANTVVQIAGFGSFEDPFELFTWESFSVDISSWPPCLFDHWTNLWETFDNGSIMEVWYSGWTISFVDIFDWSIFDDVLIPGVSIISETFDWSIFDDIFVPGLMAIFNASGIPEAFEDFEVSW